MADATCWETIKGDGETVVKRLKTLVHEGNIRRILVRHEGRTVAEFPLTAGVVGAVLAPALAAVGAIIAMLKGCSVEVERADRVDPVKPVSADRPRAAGE